MKSRKAVAIDEAAPLMVFMVFAVVAILFLYVRGNLDDAKQIREISEKKSSLEHSKELTNYLKSTDESGITVSEKISLYYHNGNYPEMNNDITNHFRSRFDSGWEFQINDKSYNLLHSVKGNSGPIIKSRRLVAEAFIPVHGAENEFIIINLYIVETDTSRIY